MHQHISFPSETLISEREPVEGVGGWRWSGMDPLHLINSVMAAQWPRPCFSPSRRVRPFRVINACCNR